MAEQPPVATWQHWLALLDEVHLAAIIPEQSALHPVSTGGSAAAEDSEPELNELDFWGVELSPRANKTSDIGGVSPLTGHAEGHLREGLDRMRASSAEGGLESSHVGAVKFAAEAAAEVQQLLTEGIREELAQCVDPLELSKLENALADIEEGFGELRRNMDGADAGLGFDILLWCRKVAELSQAGTSHGLQRRLRYMKNPKSKIRGLLLKSEISGLQQLAFAVDGVQVEPSELKSKLRKVSEAIEQGQYEGRLQFLIEASLVPQDILDFRYKECLLTSRVLRSHRRCIFRNRRAVQVLDRVFGTFNGPLPPLFGALVYHVTTLFMRDFIWIPRTIRPPLRLLANQIQTFGFSSRCIADSFPGINNDTDVPKVNRMHSPCEFATAAIPSGGVDEMLGWFDHMRSDNGMLGRKIDATRCVYGVSDLHTDNEECMRWLVSLPCMHEDTIIIAGDIGTDESVIKISLDILLSKFQHVFYVPGNHELWMADTDTEVADSVAKFFRILQICELMGVHTAPAYVGNLLIFPLFSWYRGGDEGLGHGDPGIIALFDSSCHWPAAIARIGSDTQFKSHDSLQPGIADFFVKMNERALQRIQAEAGTHAVISFSHFLPYKELFAGLESLRQVMGCADIAQQVAQCGSSVHLFGHSHMNCDYMIDGVRCVQAALGQPSDYHDGVKSILVHKPCLLWDNEPLLSKETMEKEMLADDFEQAEVEVLTPQDEDATYVFNMI